METASGPSRKRACLRVQGCATGLGYGYICTIAEWLERSGGDLKAVLEGEKLLAIDHRSPAMTFVELVESLRSNGDLVSVCEPTEEYDRSRSPVAVIEPQSESLTGEPVRIRHEVINEILRRKRTLAIPKDDIQADFESLGAWRGNTDDDGDGSTWWIDFEWWTNAVTSLRRKKPLSLTKPRKVAIDGPNQGATSLAPSPVFDDAIP